MGGQDFAATGRAGIKAITEQNSDWERHRAARVVAGNSQSVDECADLLEMLGLTAEEGKPSAVGKAAPFNPFGGGRSDK